eukprot:COSAG02_NODE_14124_length_1307_cov_2.546358_1_plen_78_part_00
MATKHLRSATIYCIGEGGFKSYSLGDDSDPASDAIILQSHKDREFVPPNADSFSKEQWGHSRIEADGDNLYNRCSDD